MSPDEWRSRFSEEWDASLNSRPFRNRQADIDAKVRLIKQAPQGAAGSERLKHDLAGLRSARLDPQGPSRIIFRLCKECREFGDQGRRPLDCCLTGDTDDMTINFLCVSAHYGDDIPDSFEFEA